MLNNIPSGGKAKLILEIFNGLLINLCILNGLNKHSPCMWEAGSLRGLHAISAAHPTLLLHHSLDGQ